MRLFFTMTAVLASALACKTENRLSPSVEALGRATGPVTTAEPPREPRRAPARDTGEPEQAAAGNEDTDAPRIVEGTVMETMDASRYTYLHLKTASGETVWAAVPKASFKAGDSVAIVESVVMHNFESKTLNLTFPSIVFGVPRDESSGKAPAP